MFLYWRKEKRSRFFSIMELGTNGITYSLTIFHLVLLCLAVNGAILVQSLSSYQFTAREFLSLLKPQVNLLSCKTIRIGASVILSRTKELLTRMNRSADRFV